ncbi:MAG: stage III sporulation protein AA, partial [Clostridiales bacterium]|nr:stage III sporulation protein AA [Clostridiales bacterium]
GLKHTLIISPPGRGKTTLLRDAARQISDIYEKTVAIADERGEIAACWMGIPQNNVGCRTDILDACPKTKAIPLLIRSMAPDVVIADEIGTNDAEVIEDAHAAGVKVFSSAHGANLTDIMKRPSVSALFAKRIFERYIILTSYGKMGINAVYDENFKSLSIEDHGN